MSTSERVMRRILLYCKHVVEYEAPFPREGERVYCRRCVDYRIVEGFAESYSLRCKECRMSRTFGADQDGARRAASRHCLKRTHAVEIRCSGRVSEVISPNPGQGELAAYESVHADEQRARYQSQRALRRFIEGLDNRDRMGAKLPPTPGGAEDKGQHP